MLNKRQFMKYRNKKSGQVQEGCLWQENVDSHVPSKVIYIGKMSVHDGGSGSGGGGGGDGGGGCGGGGSGGDNDNNARSVTCKTKNHFCTLNQPDMLTFPDKAFT
jgi:hypothetical protein